MTGRRTLNALIDRMVPEVRDIFLQVMQDIVDEAFIDEMIKAIEAGDQQALFNAVGFTPAALQPLLDVIEGVFRDAGNITGEGFPARIRTPTGSMVFRFDMRNPAVETLLRDQAGQLITRLTDEALENVRITMERGAIAGDNPRTTALDIVGRIDPVSQERIGGVIGLTNQQETWVSNAKRYLQQLDPSYLEMDLRDKRFDSIVRAAIESGTPLPADTISKLVTAYKNSALQYRGEAISRTEVIQNTNRAEFQAHMQAVAEGGISYDAITKYWDDVGDKRTRHTHLELGRKYGPSTDGINLDQPFVSPSGAQLLYPGDTSLGAPAEEIVFCRCRPKYSVDWLAGVD